MPAPSDEPLRRTEVQLYERDVEDLRRRFGQGWTTHIRALVRKDCIAHRSLERSFMEPKNG